MAAEAVMTKQIEALYERGIIRPIKPLELPEGSRLDLIIMTREEARPHSNAEKILAKRRQATALQGRFLIFLDLNFTKRYSFFVSNNVGTIPSE
jgi:predicted DNA-binding antitoxin AbrB/MazE fold protein